MIMEPRNKVKIGIPDKEGQLSFMFTRGGARRGAGRKGIGTTRKVSLTLSEATWSHLDAYCDDHQFTRSEVLRGMIEHYFSDQN
ncbi:hypothetical protein K2F33_04205 [Paenibacillus sp. PSB04]|nr:hypothetical protein K2F33_04205 [Paenibacillus sp. PSB04]